LGTGQNREWQCRLGFAGIRRRSGRHHRVGKSLDIAQGGISTPCAQSARCPVDGVVQGQPSGPIDRWAEFGHCGKATQVDGNRLRTAGCSNGTARSETAQSAVSTDGIDWVFIGDGYLGSKSDLALTNGGSAIGGEARILTPQGCSGTDGISASFTDSYGNYVTPEPWYTGDDPWTYKLCRPPSGLLFASRKSPPDILTEQRGDALVF
jgi:hypothetical protein